VERGRGENGKHPGGEDDSSQAEGEEKPGGSHDH
jgi:hypothetical protein